MKRLMELSIVDMADTGREVVRVFVNQQSYYVVKPRNIWVGPRMPRNDLKKLQSGRRRFP
jgi:hypothetical protein